MVFLYDHVISLIVGSIVVLMLFTVQQRSQQVNVERTMTYVAKKQLLEFADVLERDFTNIGYGSAPNDSVLTAFHVRADGVTDTLAFWGAKETNLGTVRVQIRYVVSLVDSVVVDEGPIPVYQLRRYEREASGLWVEAGGSPATLSRFSLTPMVAGSTNTADFQQADQLQVQVANVVMPTNYEPDNITRGFRHLYWGIMVTPGSVTGYQGE
ncbi:MAG: hypothetical protein ACE5G0_18555 [Rhodothermales bacterium]